MKKSEFKKLIKPIVAECIQESLVEGGFLSGLISEVAKGMSPTALPQPKALKKADPVLERMHRNALVEKGSKKLQEQRQTLMESIGDSSFNGVNLFEGTTPMSSEASPREMATPLAGQSPDDSGVDISSLFGSVGPHWNAHMNELKGK